MSRITSGAADRVARRQKEARVAEAKQEAVRFHSRLRTRNELLDSTYKACVKVVAALTGRSPFPGCWSMEIDDAHREPIVRASVSIEGTLNFRFTYRPSAHPSNRLDAHVSPVSNSEVTAQIPRQLTTDGTGQEWLDQRIVEWGLA